MESLELLAESVRIIAVCYLLRTIGNGLIWILGVLGVVFGKEEPLE